MDGLEVDFYRTYAQVLLKYIPGYSVPLQADLDNGTFSFDCIRLEGQFSLTDLDQSVFTEAVGELNPLYLVAKTTPLVVRLLADRRCPIKPLGAVNTRNIFKVIQPEHCTQQATNLSYVATFGASLGQRRKQGVEFAITIDVLKEDRLVLQMELWYLQFLPSSYQPVFTGQQQERQEERAGGIVETLHLTPDDPQKWAKCCQDYNPIHVSPIGARIFGFKSVIAHGNHVAAILMNKLKMAEDSSNPYVVEVEFLRPMLLPDTFEVVRAADDPVWTIRREGASKPQMRFLLKKLST